MAKKNRGWIKLYRQIQDSSIWRRSGPFDDRSAWVDLLLLANHEDRTIIIKQKPVVIHAGEHWTSYPKLAERWQWSRGKVIRYLRLLTELGMCTVHGTPNGTRITIVKYGFFQDGRTAYDTADGTAGGTADGTAGGTRTRTIEELKKNEEENARARGFVPPEGEGWQ